MLRIEILFDKLAAQKPSADVMDALKAEIERILKPQYPDMVTRVAMSSAQSINISGAKINDDKVKIQEILEGIWLDDAWLPEQNN
nr:DinI-like family protein [uncultured Moellerella sp.]